MLSEVSLFIACISENALPSDNNIPDNLPTIVNLGVMALLTSRRQNKKLAKNLLII